MTADEFVRMIMSMKDGLFRLAYHMLGKNDEAEEAVQEVIYRLWLKKSGLNQVNNPRAYALRIMRNFCLDHIKSNVSKRGLSADQVMSEDSPYSILERNNEQDHLFRLIQELPEQQRTILLLRDVEGMEFDEIVQIMQMNPNTVRVNLSRARKFLRKKISDLHNYGHQNA